MARNFLFRIQWSFSLLVGVLGLAGGCAMMDRTDIGLFYRNTPLPQNQIVQNLSYTTHDDPDPQHRLDLYLPAGTNWPVLIFAHGGDWTSGDKDQRIGGADIYGNIGRFFASRGVGVVLINYRLQPYATWQDQVQDVAKAAAWTRAHIAQYGGDSQRIFLAGDSAGAQLVSHVALNPKFLKRERLSPRVIVGVISVSGVALDLMDEQTYALGEPLPFYEQRFHVSADENWKAIASPITYVQSSAPPFLIISSENAPSGVCRQSQRLHESLTDLGVESQLLSLPHLGPIVLTLSRTDKTAGPAILEFINNHR